jgi:hypothetical protein
MKQSAVAVQVLCDRLERLFQVVEPVPGNLDVYGHEIRSLLLLACMEVEAGLSAVLQANGYPGHRWTTQDYVKLRNPMHLADYELRLTFYPRVPPISPFDTWSDSQPTQSLPWYEAYNQTKHDRESHFPAATLMHAIEAVCGAVAVFYAQFGWMEPNAVQFSLVSISNLPAFPIEEYFLWERRDPVLHSSQVIWTPVHYPL